MESEITSSKCVMYLVKNAIDNKLYDLITELKLTASSNYIFDKMFSDDKLLLFELIGEGMVLDNHCVHNDYKITGLLIK